MLNHRVLSTLSSLLVAAGISFVTTSVQAAYDLQPLPSTITYHGHLEHDGVPVNGNKSMHFKLYKSKSDCGAIDTPAWETTRSVPVYSGDFSVQLGDSNVGDTKIPVLLFRSAETSLAISVEGVALSGCQVLTPTPYAQRSAGDVPIGTVIDWWRADSSTDVPAGYQICDGSPVNNSRSPLNGKSVPNLKDKFVRGVTNVDDIGAVGGSNSFSFPQYSGSATTSNHTYTHNHRWSFITDSENWYTYNSEGNSFMTMNWGDGLDTEGTGTYPFAVDSGSSHNRYYYTNIDTHTHHHTVTVDSSPSIAKGDNVPEYVGLLKLIRIY